MPSPAASPPSSMPRAAGVIETRAQAPRRIGKVYAGPQRHHRRADRGPDRHQQGNRRRPSRRCSTRPPARSARAATSSRASSRTAREYERLIEVFRAHDIGYFFYNGGNDSADTCLKVSQIGETLGYPIICVARAEDRRQRPAASPTAARASARSRSTSRCRMREAALDVASMAKTSTKVFVLEVMGRHAGWIAAAAGLAGAQGRRSRRTSSCFPRSPFDEEKFLAQA